MMERHRTAGRIGLRLSDSVSDTGPQNIHLHRSEVQVGPRQSDHFRSTEARAADQQDHGAIADGELLQQLLKLLWSENIFIAEPFREVRTLVSEPCHEKARYSRHA